MAPIAAMGGASIIGKMVMGAPDGKALADDGNLYDSVDTAVNNATNYVIVGAGTFSESVTISTAGLTLVGSGYNTLIDGNTSGDAVTISASDVTIQNLSVKTTGGSGNSYNGIDTTTVSNISIIDVTVRDSDVHGLSLSSASNSVIKNCTIENCDNGGITVGNESIVLNCIILSTDLAIGITVNDHDTLVSNCYVQNTGTHGIRFNSNSADGVVIGCRVHNAGEDGIFVNGPDCIVANNRISGSTNSDIDNGGTGTVLDSNLTGAAN